MHRRCALRFVERSVDYLINQVLSGGFKTIDKKAYIVCRIVFHLSIIINAGNDREEEKTFFRSIDVYVNVEPCIQCCAALLEMGPPRSIFYGCANDRFGGCGSVMDVPKILGFHNLAECSTQTKPCSIKDKCILISGGHRADEAIELLKTFYKGENLNAPIEKRKPARN